MRYRGKCNPLGRMRKVKRYINIERNIYIRADMYILEFLLSVESISKENSGNLYIEIYLG